MPKAGKDVQLYEIPWRAGEGVAGQGASELTAFVLEDLAIDGPTGQSTAGQPIPSDPSAK